LNAKQLRPQNLDDIIEDLFVIDNVLTKNDTLVIIVEDEPNDTIVTRIKYLFDNDGIFIVMHNINRLQYNITNHKLVPQCNILTPQEREDLKKKYNVAALSQLPEISRFDPHALSMCLRPGDVCEFKRESATAMFYSYYRVCV
jgi:DNA-directed RNA polymerase subunit H (RpoH/RPB5)